MMCIRARLRSVTSKVVVCGPSSSRENIEETLAYDGFAREHWKRIRTNNPMERIIRQVRRRESSVASPMVSPHVTDRALVD